MAVKIEDCLSCNGPMLDLALEEDNLARLQNALCDTQQLLARQRELYAQECARTSNLTADETNFSSQGIAICSLRIKKQGELPPAEEQ